MSDELRTTAAADDKATPVSASAETAKATEQEAPVALHRQLGVTDGELDAIRC